MMTSFSITCQKEFKNLIHVKTNSNSLVLNYAHFAVLPLVRRKKKLLEVLIFPQ